jgi:hypothetical protein
MSKYQKILTKQLGMHPSTATSRLRKMLMFNFAQKLDLDICFQCGEKIKTVEELSVEHKVSWIHAEDPVKLFFDLDNIAFSHLKCNMGAARKPNKKYFTEEEKLKAYKEYNQRPEVKERRRQSKKEKYKNDKEFREKAKERARKYKLRKRQEI